MENKNITVTVKKNISGTVAFSLEDFYGEKQERTFILTPARPEVNIPLNYALSIFNERSVLGLYCKGLITVVKNKDLLFEAVDAEQIADAEYLLEITVPSDEELLDTLNKANSEDITNLLERFEDKIFDLALVNVETLSTRAIKAIEEITQIALINGD